MSDAREALVALILERFRAAETYMDLPRQAGLLADAILAAGRTPPGEHVKPSVEVGVCEHQNANYLRIMSERDELRAEVERLREDYQAACEARMMFHDELDEAQRQVADLRAGIEALATWRLVDGSPVVRRSDLRALLAESGEPPGEPEYPKPCSTCGTHYDACTTRIRSGKKACCGTCGYTATHEQNAWEERERKRAMVRPAPAVRAALAVMSDPEVLAGIAGVLYEADPLPDRPSWGELRSESAKWPDGVARWAETRALERASALADWLRGRDDR